MLVMMRRLIVQAATRSLARAFTVCSFSSLLLASACAHAGNRASTAPTRPFVNEDAGFSFDLPLSHDFAPGSGNDNVVVRSASGVRVRLFPEHFASSPSEAACWERLLVRHVSPNVADRPSTARELARVARRDGLDTGDGRLLFLQALPRNNECIVLVVEGTPEAARATAQVSLPSLRVFEPSENQRQQLLVDAALQLQQMDEADAALDRFATLFETADAPPRALALAGAVAFQVGGERLSQAIAWLERSVLLPPEQAFPDTYRPAAVALYAETLMNLGLAYAQVERHSDAVLRLAEAVVRLPNEPILTYNFACVLALAGHSDDAWHQLNDAVAIDPTLAAYALTDPDLISLHASTEWTELEEKARAASPEKRKL